MIFDTDDKQLYGYPKHDIAPELKDEKWILQYFKAFYHDFINRRGKIFYNNLGQYNQNLKYALGQQDIEQYKLMAGCDDTQKSFISTNWDIVPIMPKFIDITVGNMQKREYHIQANPIDPVSVEAEKQTRYVMEANIRLREELDKIRKIMGVDFDGGEREQLPQSLEEIELHSRLKHKSKFAIAMEKGLRLVFYLNDWTQISEQLDRDLVTHGAAGIKDYIDNNGMPRLRRVDPRNLLTQFSKTPYFSNCEAFGEIITMTMAEFEKTCGTQLNPEQKSEIAKLFSNKNNNPSDYNAYRRNMTDYRFGSPYDDVVITVMDGEFASTNKSVYERKENKYGNTSTDKKAYDYKKPANSKYKREVIDSRYSVWYKGMWIVGTDYIFNSGLATDMKVPKNSFAEALSSYHVIAPGMVDMNNISITEKMIPVADDIQLNIIKLRQAIARARNKGLLIEVGGLENIPKGKGGETFQPLELVAMYDQTGNLLYRNIDDQGRALGPPIQELENGMAKDVMNYISIINFYFGLLRDATGINEVADASTPDPDMLKGVAEMAIQSTNKALKSLFLARKYLLESVAKSLTLRIQEAVKKKELKGYAQALGGTDLEYIEVTSEVSAYEFGILIEEKPDEQEKMLFEQHLNTALQQRNQNGTGGITVADYYAVKAIDNLKLAQQYLAFIIEKRQQEDEAKAIRTSQVNAQQQQQSVLVASQAKMAELKAETDEKIRLEEAKAELQDRLNHNEFIRRLKEKEQDGNIKSDHIDQTDRNKAELLSMKTQYGSSGESSQSIA